jgi:hypothetical protein
LQLCLFLQLQAKLDDSEKALEKQEQKVKELKVHILLFVVSRNLSSEKILKRNTALIYYNCFCNFQAQVGLSNGGVQVCIQ